MISRYTHQTLTWIDLESPSKEEMMHIAEEFSIPSLVVDEAVSNTLHSKVDLYDTFMYMILHFPPPQNGSSQYSEREVDFIIGKKFIITVHYEPLYSLQKCIELFENGQLLAPEKGVSHAGLLFTEMMKQFYIHTLHKLDDITATIREIEYCIFNGKEDAMVRKISDTGRRLLNFKQALRFHGDILRSYEQSSRKLFGDDYNYYAGVVTSEFNKVNSLLESNRDALAELQRTNDSLLSTKTNDTIKTLTVMTFVMLPLTLITGIFGMNTSDALIFIHDKADFFFVIGAMFVLGVSMFIFFKIRKWL